VQREQIPAYFMLGETRGTSAGGASEAGKSLRVPGTNPFFFNDNSWQGNRLYELLESMPQLEAYVLNTGHIGGDGDGAKDVRIPDSSAIVQAIVEGTIEWETDQDFGYDVARSVPEIDDVELLQPRRLYERQGRMAEYESIVARLKKERVEYLTAYEALRPEVLEGLGA
jgi:phosphoenolpyruvate carboxykinase (ATP)